MGVYGKGNNMNISCIAVPENNQIKVFRSTTLIAIVKEDNEDDPEIAIYGDYDGLRTFTFNEIAIMMDNWENMQEMRRYSKSVPAMKKYESINET